MDALAVVTEVMIITDAFLLVDLINPIVVPYPVDLIQLEGGGLVCCLEEPVESLETGINSHAEDSLATVEGNNQLAIMYRDPLLIQPVGHVVDHVGVCRPVGRHEAGGDQRCNPVLCVLRSCHRLPGARTRARHYPGRSD